MSPVEIWRCRLYVCTQTDATAGEAVAPGTITQDVISNGITEQETSATDDDEKVRFMKILIWKGDAHKRVPFTYLLYSVQTS